MKRRQQEKEGMSAIDEKMKAAETRRKTQSRKELAEIARKVAPRGKAAPTPSRYSVYKEAQRNKQPVTEEVEYFLRREAVLQPEEEKKNAACALMFTVTLENGAETSGNHCLVFGSSNYIWFYYRDLILYFFISFSLSLSLSLSLSIYLSIYLSLSLFLSFY